MSNKFFTLCGCLLLSISVSKAQDTLVLNDGTLIKSKVVEITESLLKYKKYSNLDGPVYTIDKKHVLSVHYENGEHESFKAQEQQTVQTQSEEQTTQKEIEVPVADNNAELIAKYNEPVICKGKVSEKPAKWVMYKYGITDDSVLSNEDIEISIYKAWNIINVYGGGKYAIQVKNKTDKNIYIDLGECFAIELGKFRAFYDGTTQKSVHNGKTKGGAVNLGGVANALGVGGAIGTIADGVTLGGNSQNSLTTIYTNERFITIPPHSATNVSVYKEVVTKQGNLFSSAEYEMITPGESFNNALSHRNRKYPEGGVYTFIDYESPDRRRYIITYSKDPNFSVYTKIEFNLWLQQVISTSAYMSNYNTSMIIDGPDFLIKRSYLDKVIDTDDYAEIAKKVLEQSGKEK